MNGIRQSLYSLDLFSLTFRNISLAVLRRGAVATVSVCLSVCLSVVGVGVEFNAPLDTV